MSDKPELTKRSQVFGLKMSRQEISILKERANRTGMSAGAYLRFLFHQDIKTSKKENNGQEKHSQVD